MEAGRLVDDVVDMRVIPPTSQKSTSTRRVSLKSRVLGTVAGLRSFGLDLCAQDGQGYSTAHLFNCSEAPASSNILTKIEAHPQEDTVQECSEALTLERNLSPEQLKALQACVDPLLKWLAAGEDNSHNIPFGAVAIILEKFQCFAA